jgi:hypothetical protein
LQSFNRSVYQEAQWELSNFSFAPNWRMCRVSFAKEGMVGCQLMTVWT